MRSHASFLRAAGAAALLSALLQAGAHAQDPAPHPIWGSPESMAAFNASLERQTGAVTLLDGDVTLQIPESLYFLDADDSERVLVDAWGNPSAEGTIGMIFAAKTSPLDEGVWGLEIMWEDSGYVSDEDAATIDYDQLLADLQEEARQESRQREREGFESVELVGWATAPRYNADTHRLYWARELKFGGTDVNTLNYNIRVLGREGVLVMNFIADIDALDQIEAAAPAVLEVASFAPGKRYEDFDPSVDRMAGYGLAGLIAGGAGALALKKTGLLAVALVFLKKGWVLLVAAGAGILTWIRGLFRGKGGGA
jgi:uncharacterized membrane-anchored protein